MAGLRVAYRYAKGLMMFAQETNQTEQVYKEMSQILKLTKESEEIKSFLNSPLIDAEQKDKILLDIFSKFSTTSKNFISLVVKQGRENILDKIAKQFISIFDQDNEIIEVEITSATDLSQQTVDSILAKIKESRNPNAQFKVICKQDTSLIGGFILKIGNYQIDSSIKSKIATLKKEFSKNDYIPKY